MTSRKYFVWAGVLIAIAASFAAGLRTGARLGIEQFLAMDSSARASVLTYQLQALRAGNIDKIIEATEIEVDGNVVTAIEFQKSGVPWLFLPNDSVWHHDRSLKHVAEYRKQYPPLVPKFSPLADAPDPGDLRGFAKRVELATGELLERYGK